MLQPLLTDFNFAASDLAFVNSVVLLKVIYVTQYIFFNKIGIETDFWVDIRVEEKNGDHLNNSL